MRFAFKHDKSRKLECIMSSTAWVTSQGNSLREFRIRKQVSFLYKATADVKIALGIKVVVRDSLMFFLHIWSRKSYQANRKIIAKP